MREGWRETTLGEIAAVAGGGTPRTSAPDFWGGEIVWLTPTEVAAAEGTVIEDSRRKITKIGLNASGAKLLPRNTVLLTSRATVGAVAMAGCELSTNQGFQSLLAGDGVLPWFLLFWVQHNKAEFTRRASGSTFPEISRSEVRRIPILLPPLDEQRRIVDLIAAVDEAIEAAEQQLVEARRCLAALAVELLDGGRGRMTLGDAAEVTIGRQRSPKNAAGEHLVKYLRAANVKDGRLEIDDVLEMNFDPREQATFNLQPGDILVSEGCGSLGQLGASASWHAELPGTVCFQNTLLRLRSKDGVTIPRYLDHLARHAFRSGWWASIASGTNIFHIGLERAKRLPVPVPSLVEQERVTVLLDSLSGVTTEVSSLLASLKTLRSALLADLLSGEHEIPDSYDALLSA